MGKIRVSAEEYAEKHARRLKGAVEDIRRGVDRVSEAPTAKAADKQDKMLANLQAAVSSGKWARRLRAVTLEEWKDKTLTKGIGRIAAGIDAAHGKQVAFAEQLLAFEGTLLEKVDKMSDMTLEDSIAKMTAWARGMSKFSKK